MSAEQRLRELGIALPQPGAPAGNYAAAVRSQGMVYLSGKAPPAAGGVKPRGRLGVDHSAEDGYAMARSACIDLLASLREAIGSLDAVVRVVELHGSLCTSADFEDHARVLDGASDLLAEVFGAAGVHARSVIGVYSLRGGVPLTLKATVEVMPSLDAAAVLPTPSADPKEHP